MTNEEQKNQKKKLAIENNALTKIAERRLAIENIVRKRVERERAAKERAAKKRRVERRKRLAKLTKLKKVIENPNKTNRQLNDLKKKFTLIILKSHAAYYALMRESSLLLLTTTQKNQEKSHLASLSQEKKQLSKVDERIKLFFLRNGVDNCYDDTKVTTKTIKNTFVRDPKYEVTNYYIFWRAEPKVCMHSSTSPETPTVEPTPTGFFSGKALAGHDDLMLQMQKSFQHTFFNRMSSKFQTFSINRLFSNNGYETLIKHSNTHILLSNLRVTLLTEAKLGLEKLNLLQVRNNPKSYNALSNQQKQFLDIRYIFNDQLLNITTIQVSNMEQELNKHLKHRISYESLYSQPYCVSVYNKISHVSIVIKNNKIGVPGIELYPLLNKMTIVHLMELEKSRTYIPDLEPGKAALTTQKLTVNDELLIKTFKNLPLTAPVTEHILFHLQNKITENYLLPIIGYRLLKNYSDGTFF